MQLHVITNTDRVGFGSELRQISIQTLDTHRCGC